MWKNILSSNFFRKMLMPLFLLRFKAYYLEKCKDTVPPWPHFSLGIPVFCNKSGAKTFVFSTMSLYSFKLHRSWRCFLVCTAHSQHPNLCESHWIKCESMLLTMNPFPYLWGILNSITTVVSLILFFLLISLTMN